MSDPPPTPPGSDLGLDHGIAGVVTTAAVGLAAVLAVDPAGWFPFSIVKWWAVVVVVLVSVGAWSRMITFRALPSAMALAAVCILVGVSAAFGLDPHHAWLGTPVRHLGVLAWLSFLGAHLVGVAVGRAARDAPARIAHAVIVVGAVLSVYVVWEALVGRPVEYSAATDRLGGPFGSPAYLGAMSSLILPAAIGVAADHRAGRGWRAAGAATAFGVSGALLGSGSRGALLAVGIVAVVVTAVVVAGRRSTRRHADSGAMSPGSTINVAVAVAVAVGVGVALSLGAIAVARGVFERSAGWATRLDEWHLALRVSVEAPLLGAGPEGYRIAAFASADDDYVRRFGDAIGTDRAHSGVLDVAVSSGWPAALAYGVALAVVAIAVLRVVRTGGASEVGVASGVLAAAIGQQFLFPVGEIDPLFWLLAGTVVAATSREPGCGRGNGPGHNRPRRRLGIVAIACIALVGIAGVVGVRHSAADRLARDSTRASTSAEATDLASRAVSLAPDDLRLRVLLARSQSATRSLAAADAAISTIEAAFERSPLDPVVRIERARLLSARAEITGLTVDRDRARLAWDTLVEDAPSCARCHLGAALAAGERGDVADAVVSLRRAAALGNRDASELLDRLSER